MAPTLRYHCACSSTLTVGSNKQPPLANLKSSDAEFHLLSSLYFCEECDAVRCPRCVALEVSGYYCPNCLFEVPSASVRGEKNRCARNCFQCPHCHNTLSVVPSDPPERDPGSRLPIIINPVGEPPFILHCSFCRWDSEEVGISFEKPTGLALQLQRFEDSAPETLEFDRLKDHFEPLIRAAGSGPSSHASARHNPITAAASHALAREVHGVPRHQISKTAGRTGKSKAPGDPWDTYQARNSASGGDSGLGAAGGAEDVEWMRNLERIEDVAPIEARWDASWSGSLRASSLAPLRIPLHSKMSVRCATCRHILIKPEQKSQSVRYKIKLMASNYLPLLDASLTSTANAPPRLTQGRSFPFSITIANPLYDSIQVRFQPYNPATYPNISRPSFHVTLPQGQLSVAAFAEAWEYDDDEEEGDQDQMMLDALEGGAGLADVVKAGGSHSANPSRGKSGTIGVLERRANMIRVGGEVAVSRDGSGDVKFTMLVTYQYRAEEPAEEQTQGQVGRSSASQLKSFSFLTMLNLGTIHTKEQLKEQSVAGK